MREVVIVSGSRTAIGTFGSGLKDVNSAMRATGKAPIIEPTLEAVKALI